MADLSNHYGSTIVKSDETVRPADTTPYTAGDGIASATTDTGTTILHKLSNIVRESGGSGYIVGCRLWTNQAANVSAYKIHFYKVGAPVTAIPGDNVAMTLNYANFAQRIGSIDLSAMKTSTVAGSSDAAGTSDMSLRHFFSLSGTDSKDLYYRIETVTGFTPASGQKFLLEVAVENN